MIRLFNSTYLLILFLLLQRCAKRGKIEWTMSLARNSILYLLCTNLFIRWNVDVNKTSDATAYIAEYVYVVSHQIIVQLHHECGTFLIDNRKRSRFPRHTKNTCLNRQHCDIYFEIQKKSRTTDFIHWERRICVC